MDDFPISKLNAELEQFRSQIVEKIKDISNNPERFSKEEMDSRVEDIKNLQSIIQVKTNQYFDMVAEKARATSYTEEQLSELTAKVKENIKNIRQS